MRYLRNDNYSSNGQFCRYDGGDPKNPDPKDQDNEAEFIAYEDDGSMTHQISPHVNLERDFDMRAWYDIDKSQWDQVEKDWIEYKVVTSQAAKQNFNQAGND